MSRPAPALSTHGALLVTALALFVSSSVARADLPTPGGAAGSATGDGTRPFTGLAETPRAAAFTGAAVTSIPLEMPPGRAGATPRLELRYSSGDGPSAYGYGWSLPIARVVRSTKHGVPGYDPADTFVLETNGGSLELEPVTGTKRYVARIESAFLRIGFDVALNQWKVIDKSGAVMLFGTSAATRTGPGVSAAGGTFAWLLARSVDATGNHVDYSYLPPGSGEGSTSGLPSRIDYGGNLRAGIAHTFSARFAWTTPAYPSIVPVSFHGGFAQPRRRLLLSVDTYVGQDLVRRYAMSHQQDAASGAVRLVGVSLDGFAAESSFDVALPSTTFSYSDAVTTDWPIGSATFRASVSDAVPSPGPLRGIGAEIRFDTFDINGDGRVDWVDSRPAQPMVRLGTAAGFGPLVAWSWPAVPHTIRRIDSSTSNLVVNVFDITGDGLPDLVDGRSDQCQSNRWCVYRNTGSGFETTALLWWSPRNHIRHAHSGGNRVLIDVADLNGDGRPDWIDTTSFDGGSFPYWIVHWNTGSGFSQEPFHFRAHRAHISRIHTSDPRQYLSYGLFDMNGDALPDFVVSDTYTQQSGQDHWDVYLNNGSGFETAPLDWRVEGGEYELPARINETEGSSSSSMTYKDLVDMTGDGLPDWIRPWSSADAMNGSPVPQCDQQPACAPNGTALPPECCFSFLVFVNTGSSFSHPVPWSLWHDYELRHTRDSIPSGERQFELLDFDGDGLIDLLEITAGSPWRVFRHPASPLARWSQTPLERRARPNLLLSMMNGVGGETHLSYAPASAFSDNRIPFAYWAVVRREVRDGITNSTAASSTYRYAGGLWAGNERELRGFHHVWETDAAGTTVATEYHQDQRLQGLVLESQVLGPAPCSTTDPMDPSDPCSPLNDRLRIDTNAWSSTGPVLLEARSSTPYYNNMAVANLSKVTGYVYDVYGNVVREAVYSPSVGTVATETTYVYTLFDEVQGWPGRYLVDKPIHAATRRGNGPASILAEKTYAYDAAFPVTGLVTRASTCIDWSASACARWKTITYEHDKAGNVESVAGPRGGVTKNEYDANLLYAREVRNPLGHATESVHDLRTGRETFKRAPDGRVFETIYDGLGRPVRSWSDGFSRNEPEVSTTYRNGVPGGAPGWVRTRQHGSAPVVVFFDGLGRDLATKTIAETTSGEQTTVGGLKLYDSAGRVSAQSVTFLARDARLEVLAETAADAPGWTRNVYDDHGRLIETVLPDDSRTRYHSSKPGVRVAVYANLSGGEHPGKADIELLDGLGRTWRKDTCSAAPAASDLTRCRAGTLLERAEYVYDGLDRPTRISNGAHTSNPAVTLLAYDGLGNRTSFASSDLGAWSYEYDAEEFLTKAVDPRGATVTNEYDAIGRLRRQRSSGFDARYAYHKTDAGAGLVRRIRARSGAAKMSKDLEYDTRARVVREDVSLRAGGPSLRNTTLYEYDDADRRVAVTYPTERSGHSRKVVTTYSRYGRPTALTAYDDDTPTDIVRDVGYDLLGNTRLVHYGNGLSDVFAYSTPQRLGRLECLRTTRDLTPSVTCTSDPQDERRVALWSRDDAGNILGIADYLHAPGSPLRDDHTFGYDSLGRLVSATRSGTSAESFTYDAHGNMSASQGGVYTYTAGAPHLPMIGSDEVVEHDAAGNRTKKGSWTYAYDGMGRLSEVRRGGTLRERAYYDEGRTRVARFNAETGSVRYYVGGLFEVEDSTLVRHYWLGGRIVASDVVQAPDELRVAGTTGGAAAGALGGLARSSNPDVSLHVPGAPSLDTRPLSAVVSPDSDPAIAAALLLALVLFLVAAALCGPAMSGIALVTAMAVIVATTPFPAHAERAATGSRAAIRHLDRQSLAVTAHMSTPRAATTRLFFYHPDHLGSPYVISDATGNLVEHRRYDAYGKLRVALSNQGLPISDPASEISFTGQMTSEPSGLIYFGSRYYDPDLGLFLTPDPQAQFASPYLYGGGNPVNGVDPDGEFLQALIPLLVPLLLSAAVSALVSGITAALQGGDFLEAFGAGFVGGLIGGALGTLVGGLNIAYQFLAGGAQYIQAAEAFSALVEVAARSSFTSAVSNSAVSIADAAGLSSDWVTAIAVVTPLLASFAYDNYIIKDSGAAKGGGTSQREMARNGLQKVNTSTGHTNVTSEAVQGTGWERHTSELVARNLAEDGPEPTGCFLRDGWNWFKSVSMNQGHFGRLPSTIDGLHEGAARGMKTAKELADAFDPLGPYRHAVGAGTHYVQDHLTLGHMVPGTSLFWGPPGAPIRFVIHQVFGGEVAFRNAQLRATHGFLLKNGLVT